jgi:hypothetical protein
MENELKAKTEAGQELVTMAERFAEDFSAGASHYDRFGEFPNDHLQALKLAGFLYAPVPVHCGGMGVESVHDLMVATSRLARGDASLTLGVNMHLLTFVSFARQWRMAKNRGDEARAGQVEASMSSLMREGAVIAAAISEPDQDLIRPQTEAILTDAGWVINGLKIFCSMAPAATHFTTAVRYTDDAGMERYAYAVVPRDTPGLTVNDDWDALGMRARERLGQVRERRAAGPRPRQRCTGGSDLGGAPGADPALRPGAHVSLAGRGRGRAPARRRGGLREAPPAAREGDPGVRAGARGRELDRPGGGAGRVLEGAVDDRRVLREPPD